jgi:hypothetical protein
MNGFPTLNYIMPDRRLVPKRVRGMRYAHAAPEQISPPEITHTIHDLLHDNDDNPRISCSKRLAREHLF